MIHPYLTKWAAWWLITHRNHLGKRLSFFHKNDSLEERQMFDLQRLFASIILANSKPDAREVLSRLYYYIHRQIYAMNKGRCRADILEIPPVGMSETKITDCR